MSLHKHIYSRVFTQEIRNYTKGQIVIKFFKYKRTSKHRNNASISEAQWLEMQSEDDKCLQHGITTLA